MSEASLPEGGGAPGRVIRLEVENFKSYRGKCTIGPFKNFTTIIGPNGSGKSNLMDAISFVLGVPSRHLRGANVRELLYTNSRGAAPEDRPRRAEVALVLEGEGGGEVRFSRAIVPAGAADEGGDPAAGAYTSQYRVDGRPASAEAYAARLKRFNILVKARNFLVFQGDIESVAQMSPADLTALFEQVSGSAEHRRPYEAAEEALREAEARAAAAFAKRKTVAAERRARAAAAAEADRHAALAAEAEAGAARLALWRLYHLDEDAAEARAAAAADRAALARAEAGVAAAEAAAEAARRAQAALAKERLLAEKRAKKKGADADRRNPALIRARERIAALGRRVAACEAELGAARSKAAAHAARLEELRRQGDALADAQAALEAEAAEEAAKGKLALSPELLAQYAALKAEAGAATAGLAADRAALQAAADADAEALRLAQEAVAAADGRLQELRARAAAERARADELAAAAAAAAAERAARLAERERALSERRRVEARREHLARKLDDADGALREARAERKEGAREARAREFVREQQRALGAAAVLGRASDLADVPDARHRLALAVAMGKDFDAVVVDRPETAVACIEAAKAARLPPMTFLPADTIRTREVPDALRALPGARLAIDLLRVKDPRATRAFAAACGDTLVADSVAAARALAFDGGARRKVVALDGTAFAKSGLITGGVTPAMEERAAKWDAAAAEAAVDALRAAREAVAAELAALPPLREVAAAAAAADAALARLDNAAHFAAADAKACAQRLREAEEQVAALERERAARAPGAAELEKRAAARAGRLAALTAKIEAATDKVFAAFSKKVGVASIREYEARHLSGAERLAEARARLATQAARVRNQAEYEARSDAGAAAAAAEAALEAARAALAEARAEEAACLEASAGVRAELGALAEEVKALKARAEAGDAEVRRLRREAGAAADAAAALRRDMGSRAAEAARLEAERAEVLAAAEMEGLPLPLAGAAKQQQKRGKAKGKAAEGDAGGDDMDVDKENAPAPGAKPPAALDYSSLAGVPGALARDAAARRRHEDDERRALEETRAALARLAPNLRAAAQLAEAARREDAHAREVEAARAEARAAADAFAAVRAARHDAFVAAFNHVAAAIDPIYKRLTAGPAHPGGGQAYLALEDSGEPYRGGVKFTAMPPTKRFRDMEQLSGGEKTVAALALLFAVHSFQPSPFFVLDEVDAALDGGNVARVAAHLAAATRDGAPGGFQGIVISLKDALYERADALVGVCRDADAAASATFTYDLSRHDAAAR